MKRYLLRGAALLVGCMAGSVTLMAEDRLQPIQYNNPGMEVDLGVGLWAWPLPMDYDRDGDLDLVVSCPDVPMSGTWFFENPGADDGQGKQHLMPVFKPPVRIANKGNNVQVSYVDGEPVVMSPGKIYANFRDEQYSQPITLPLPEKIDPLYQRYRANQWRLVDWEQDGDLDVVVGIEVWDDYGWDDAWDAQGHWKNGPLHGYVYLVENTTKPANTKREIALTERLKLLAQAAFAAPRKIETTEGKPLEVYGMPSPSFADFDNDGDLDLVCGEFLDGFTWFENVGTRQAPQFAIGRILTQPHQVVTTTRDPLHMDLQMITPVAFDWDGDGHMDLVCGDEDGRVALIRAQGKSTEHMPDFEAPVYFRQTAQDIKFGALVTPTSADWDGDGDFDLLCGNTAGYLGWIENLGGGEHPQWSEPRRLREIEFRSGATIYRTLRYEAGPTGSIQGPCEAKWGYTTPVVADWNSDGRLDLVVNGIWGKVTWHERTEDGELVFSQPVQLSPTVVSAKPEWTWWTPEPEELVTQWRTTPGVIDWNQDGLLDLVMLDHEGYLAFYERQREATSSALVLLPPRRIFKMTGACEFDSRQKPVGTKQDDLLRLNAMPAGASGRRKLCFTDWDGDGRMDVLVNSENANWLRNVKTDDAGFTWFEDLGPLDSRKLAGHSTSPTTVDWDQNGVPDLLIGAEDGRLYLMRNPRAETLAQEQ